MTFYARIFLIAGVIVPVALHLLARETTPWWPDTVSMGLGFGAAAVLVAHQGRRERALNRRLWRALKELTNHRGSN